VGLPGIFYAGLFGLGLTGMVLLSGGTGAQGRLGRVDFVRASPGIVEGDPDPCAFAFLDRSPLRSDTKDVFRAICLLSVLGTRRRGSSLNRL
jgi:hypothetical protein